MPKPGQLRATQSTRKSSLYKFIDSYLEKTEPDEVEISRGFNKRKPCSDKIDANEIDTNYYSRRLNLHIKYIIRQTFRRMQKYIVEFFGTMLFVYIILATGNALAIGATLALLILLMGNISGGHVNPAVSIVMAAAGKLPTTDLVPYCIAQILGGLVALEIYKRVRI